MGAPNDTQTEFSLLAKIEALLFVAPGSVPPSQLAKTLEVSTQEIKNGLKDLEIILKDRGLRLQWHQGNVQMTTAAEASPYIEKLLDLDTFSRLTQAALETLAIIAYKQPITHPQIASIRGVNCDSVLKNLLSKGLIQEMGRAVGPGRPFLYATTPEFLSHFGISSLTELPELTLPEHLNDTSKEEYFGDEGVT
ncbi:MAG: SMC-Scp complex subunit ScpB [Chloroflexota bacterium]